MLSMVLIKMRLREYSYLQCEERNARKRQENKGILSAEHYRRITKSEPASVLRKNSEAILGDDRFCLFSNQGEGRVLRG